MAPISKALATNIHHLISYLLPDHAGSRPLTSASTQKIVSELADLVAPIVGSTLNGVQADLEWEHCRPVVVSGPATPLEIPDGYVPCQGDQVEAWLTRMRDQFEPGDSRWVARDDLREDYRALAEDHVPLKNAL